MSISRPNSSRTITAVIVTFNRKNKLRCCIESVLKQTARCDVVIVDNGSTDGTESLVRAYDDPRIRYYNTGANLGGAGGFHFGIKAAAKAGYDYIWLMDDDCRPEKDALEAFLNADVQLKGKYGWLSSKTLWTDGSLCKMNVQRKTPYTDISFCKEDGPLTQACMASFVSLFIKRSTVKEYGLPIKEFFIWSDDWEYTRRISMHEQSFVVSDSAVVHDMNSNTTVNISDDTSDRMDRYDFYYRNDVYLYRREGMIGWVWIIAKFLWHSVQVLFKSDKKIKRLKTIWTGFSKGLSFCPPVEYLNLTE